MLELRLQDLKSLCSSLDLISPGCGRKQNAARMSAEENLALYLTNVQRFTAEMLNILMCSFLKLNASARDANKNRRFIRTGFFILSQLKIFV